VSEVDDIVGEAAKVAPANIPRPQKALFLPTYPAHFIAELRAFVRTVWGIQTAGYTAVTALVVARTMVEGLDPACKATRKSLHKVLDRFGMVLPGFGAGLGSEPSQQGSGGGGWWRSRGEVVTGGVLLSWSQRRGSVDGPCDERANLSLADIAWE
jgi:hypothetical protein